jgi:hypothetical protein
MPLKENLPFERTREEIEARQREAFWAHGYGGSYRVVAFLWKGDPAATPFQRAALVFFALISFLATIYMASSAADGDRPWDERIVGTLGLLVPLLISMRLFRNAMLQRKTRRKTDGSESTD